MADVYSSSTWTLLLYEWNNLTLSLKLKILGNARLRWLFLALAALVTVAYSSTFSARWPTFPADLRPELQSQQHRSYVTFCTGRAQLKAGPDYCPTTTILSS